MARTEVGGRIQALCPLAVRGAPKDSLLPVCGHGKHIFGFYPVQALPHPEQAWEPVWEEKVPAAAGPGQDSPWIQHFLFMI